MRIDTSLVNKTVVVFQNTLPPQDLHLQQLYQMVEISKSRGAAYIICVVPYLAYSRQDRRSNEGEPESGLVVLRTLAMLGANDRGTRHDCWTGQCEAARTRASARRR
ncbi:ribose-phosphate pyrophosphokinase [Paenibacillus sp. JNUCC31]|nr:ribose-phosphate pyrophosphokinase [Paenibacillus sp. JNUCC-31]